jgi:hypothetical protein
LAGIGSLISAASAIAILYMIVRVALLGMPYQAGWASTMVTISFFGGLNLLAIGIVGLYVAQVFAEVKGRPCIVKDVQANFARNPSTTAATSSLSCISGDGKIAIASASADVLSRSPLDNVPANGDAAKAGAAGPASEPRHA